MKLSWAGSGNDGGQPPSMSGRVYTDGHCTRKPVRELQRAAWSIVELDGEGEVSKWVEGIVPAAYPQSVLCPPCPPPTAPWQSQVPRATSAAGSSVTSWSTATRCTRACMLLLQVHACAGGANTVTVGHHRWYLTMVRPITIMSSRFASFS